MTAFRPLHAICLGLATLLLAVRAEAKDDEKPFRIAFVGPLSGPLAASGQESVDGLKFAADAKNAAGGVGRRKVEIQTFDDKDEAAALDKALLAAHATKPDAIIAAPTGRTIEAFEAREKKSKTPTILVGSVGAKPTIDLVSPSLFIGAWPVDHAIAISMALVAPCASVVPGLVVEDTPRGREIEAAIRRNAGPRQSVCGTVWVAPGGTPSGPELKLLKDKLCDRLVLVGEPDLVDRTVESLKSIAWDAPLLLGEGMLSRAAASLHDGRATSVFSMVGSPQRTVDAPPRAILDAMDKGPNAGRAVYERTIAAFTAADLLFAAAESLKSKKDKELEVIAALRDQRYGDDESKVPFFDAIGRASLYHWRLWQAGKKGPEPVETAMLPIEGFGPYLRTRTTAMYPGEPGTKIVWLTFGEAKGKPPRTIEKDMADLHLGTRGYEGDLDKVILDELMARAMGKLNKLFLRNEDGSPIPGVSWNISFTTTKPEKLKPHEYWTALIAGDDPDAGGRAWPGNGYCEIYATFLKRTIFLKNALDPPMSQEDKKYVDGTYVKGMWKLQHLRADQIRCLVDGYAGSFALTGAHEVGHIAGLAHDTVDPRSIMNVAEGVGLRETQAFFIPAHAEILDRLLGRYEEKKK